MKINTIKSKARAFLLMAFMAMPMTVFSQSITILVGPDNSANGTVNGTNEAYFDCTVGDVITVTAAGIGAYEFISWRDGYTNEYLPYANYSTNPLQLTVTQAMVDEVTNTWGGFYIIMAEFSAGNVQVSAQVVPQDAGHITGTGIYTYGATAGLTVYEDNPIITILKVGRSLQILLTEWYMVVGILHSLQHRIL